MNSHEAVLQPIAAFVYCNRHAAAGRHRQTKVGNFRAPAGACATNSAHQLTPPMGEVSLKKIYDETRREIK